MFGYCSDMHRKPLNLMFSKVPRACFLCSFSCFSCALWAVRRLSVFPMPPVRSRVHCTRLVFPLPKPLPGSLFRCLRSRVHAGHASLDTPMADAVRSAHSHTRARSTHTRPRDCCCAAPLSPGAPLHCLGVHCGLAGERGAMRCFAKSLVPV